MEVPCNEVKTMFNLFFASLLCDNFPVLNTVINKNIINFFVYVFN